MEQKNPGVTFTSSQGRFLIRNLDRAGPYVVIAEAEGYAAAEVKGVEAQAEGAGEELTISLFQGSSLEGVVIDAASGLPLDGIEALSAEFEGAEELVPRGWENYNADILKLRKTVTGSDGRFRLLEGKPASLLFRGPGRRRLFLPPARRPEFQGPGGLLRIPLERGETLSGVYYFERKPAAGVEIRLDRLKKSEAGSSGAAAEIFDFIQTGTGGKFGWSDLAPGWYRLVAVHRVREPAPNFEVEAQQAIEVQPGEDNIVELGKNPGSWTLRGRLAGMEERVSLWAGLRLKPASGSGEEFYFKTYKDWDWRYSCPFLSSGKYSATIEYYTESGTRELNLPDLEIAADLEHDFKVPAEGK